MTTTLGTLEELPLDYRQALAGKNLAPLWPSLRNFLPFERPARRTRPTLWRYAEVRPELMRAGELAPIEKAERRVLVLANPGFGADSMQATASIYLGLQLIHPGEVAPNHRHTPCAVRFVVEGEGGYTVVDGEKCPMERGDLILTPPGMWHEHGHEGKGPVIWLDALDLPLIYWLEASYCVEGPRQAVRNKLDASQTRYRRHGLLPYETLDRRRIDYPLLRFPWKDVRESLLALAGETPAGRAIHLAYVNPETGAECLPSLGFSALMIRPGEAYRPPRRAASAVLHAVEGEGVAGVDGVELAFGPADTIAVPTHADLAIENATAAPVFLFMVDDAPLLRKLRIHEVIA